MLKNMEVSMLLSKELASNVTCITTMLQILHGVCVCVLLEN